MSAADKPPILEREILGNEDVSVYSVDDILATSPELTALRAKIEDMSVCEDGECMTSARRTEPGTSDEVVIPTTCSTDVTSPAGAKPRISSDHCPRDNSQDGQLICCQIPDRRNVQDYIPTAVHEVTSNSWNTSSDGLTFTVNLEHDICEECHECEPQGDKRGLVGLLPASEAASDLRYVSSLLVTLVNEPSFSQTLTPSRSNNEESFVTNVSKRIMPIANQKV